MKSLMSIAVSASVLLACSCTAGEAELMREETLSVSFQGQTKVALDSGMSLSWSEGDCLSVFYRGGENELWSLSDPENGLFSHKTTQKRDHEGPWVAILPYEPGAKIENNAVKMDFPIRQYRDHTGHFPAIMGAVSQNGNLDLCHLASYLKLTYSGSGSVSKVILTSLGNESLTGSSKVVFKNSGPVLTVDGNGPHGRTVSVMREDGKPLDVLDGSSADYWIALPECSLSSGFSIRVEFEGGKSETHLYEAPLTLEAGKVYCYSAVQDIRRKLSIKVDFSGNPFTEDLPEASSKEEKNFVLERDGQKYNFLIHPQDPGSAVSWGYRRRVNEGDLLIGRDGAWIGLPVIEGMALSSLTYTAGSTNGVPFLCDVTENTYPFSNSIGQTVRGYEYTMVPTQLKYGQPVYLIVGSGNLLIMNMTLEYVSQE